MKLVAVCLMIAVAALEPYVVQGQGNLTPPGPPAPTMKTLDQVQPQTPVDAVHTPGNGNNVFIISQSGSYYLTTNVVGVASKNGISLQADNVTLDLRGFILFGSVTNSQVGILVSGTHVGIKIRNGTIRDWGGNGLGASNASGSEFGDLQSIANTGVGIRVGTRNTLHNCAAKDNGSDGIVTGDDCLLTQCILTGNGLSGAILGASCSILGGLAAYNEAGPTALGGFSIGTGYGCMIKDMTVSWDYGGEGIDAGGGNSVINCTASFCYLEGISVGNDSTIKDCISDTNNYNGIQVGNQCNVIGCTACGNLYDGINAQGSGSLVKNCLTSQNGNFGIDFLGENVQVQDCSALANAFGGILTGDHCIVTGCIAKDNFQDGIDCHSSCLLANNVAMGNAMVGINVGAYGNRVDSNHVRDNKVGIQVLTTGGLNVVVRNTAGNNSGGNYNTDPGNAVGTIVSDPTSSSANAWANLQN